MSAKTVVCPVHPHETEPSCLQYEDRSFYCFRCGASGRDFLSFKAAVESDPDWAQTFTAEVSDAKH